MRIFFVIFCIFLQTACDDKMSHKMPRKMSHNTNQKSLITDAKLVINPLQVIPESEFDIVLSFASDNDRNVKVLSAFMQGESMYMGKIPVFFKASSTNQFVAKAMVGVCSVKEMIWKITVVYKFADSDIIYTKSLNFTVVHTG